MPLTNLGKITVLIVLLSIFVLAPTASEYVNNEIDKYNDKIYQRGFRDGEDTGFQNGFGKGIEYEKNWTPCEWKYSYPASFNFEIGMTLCEKLDTSHVMSVDKRFNKEYEYQMPDWSGQSVNWTTNDNCLHDGGYGGYGYYVVDFS